VNVALQAFQQSTPEAWFSLLRMDLEALPHLRRTVLRLLQELPAADTALTASEMKLLKVISGGATSPLLALAEHVNSDRPPVLDYWELGRTLDQLANYKEPAVLGLDEGPFTLAMHESRRRFERFKRSNLSLSELEQALVDGREDFSRHNPIDRWWGGTKLTNDCLWRWDRASAELVRPT
jgi:hypothetical protein